MEGLSSSTTPNKVLVSRGLWGRAGSTSSGCHTLFLLAMVALLFTGCEPEQKPESTPTPSPTPAVIPPPKPTPTPTIARKPMDTAQLFNGVTFVNKLVTPQSEKLASTEREDPSSYVAEIKVTVEKPRPSTSLADFQSNDPGLATILGKIPDFPDKAQVSPAFEKLYGLKINWVRERLSKLDQLLSRHNFYDCETILEFTAPGSGRPILLLKGDMDVNTDGSDGDRNIEVDGSSRFFQPQTSYRWKKLTDRPNPFLERTETRLGELKAQYSVKGLSAEKNAELKSGIEMLSRRVYDLKSWSFLVSANDPAIVVPGFMLRAEDGRAPYVALGDYAVVFYDGKGYPAIVGDAGPSFKFGEASMRLCKELNAKSSAMARPVSDLNVAYLVFPGSADEPGPPDLAKWREQCAKLLAEIGLGDVELHTWEDLVKPWPTPTPEPTPAPGEPAAAEPPAQENSSAPADADAATPEESPQAAPAPQDGGGPSPTPAETKAPDSETATKDTPSSEEPPSPGSPAMR